MPTIPKQAKSKKQSDTRAERAKIYNTRRWQKLRRQHLKLHPTCALCEQKGIVRVATDVHHINSFMNGNTRSERTLLAYDPNNLQSLCQECHSQLHGGRKRTKGKIDIAQEQAEVAEIDHEGGRGVKCFSPPHVNPIPVTFTQTEVLKVFDDSIKKEASDPPSDTLVYIPPSGVLSVVRDYILRIYNSMSSVKIWRDEYRAPLDMLAHNLDVFYRATILVNQQGLILRTSGGKMMKNPLIKVANEAQIQAVKIAQDFGLTAKSRERIKALDGDNGEEDALTAFLDMISKR